MKKRIISFVLVMTLLLGLSLGAFAAEDQAENPALDAAETLYALGLMKGKGNNPDGSVNFDLEAKLSRQEAVTMLVRLLGKEEEAQSGEWEIPFTDVDSWAVPYVGYAYANGLTNGTGATTFEGRNSVTATQYITFVLRALGYSSATDFVWDRAWELSDSLGISDGEYNQENNSLFIRAGAALLSLSALSAENKDGSGKLIQQLVDEGAVDEQAAADAGLIDLEMVWIPQSGSKYHCNPDCSGMENPVQVSVSEAEEMGYTPCKKCYG